MTNGTVQTGLQIVGFDTNGVTEDICGAIPCPVQPGKFVFKKTIPIPINMPFVDWHPRVAFLDGTDDAKEMMCIRVHLQLVSSGISHIVTYASLFTAVSAGFTTLLMRYLRSGYEPTIYDMSSGWAPTARLLPSRVGPSFMHVALFAQFIAASGQLNFDYPAVYQDFVRLFTWATGTWNVSFIRSIANHIRNGGLVVLAQEGAEAKARTGARVAKLIGRQMASPGAPTFDGVPQGTAITGYERYTAMVGMTSKEMFLNTLIPFLFVLLIILFAGTGLAFIRFVYRRRTEKEDIFANDDGEHHHIRHYMGGWAVRTLILFYFGLTSTSLHQLTLANEPPSVMALAGIVFVVFGVMVPIGMTLRLIGIARMNRTLDQKDPEIADKVYAKSVRGNIQNFRRGSESEGRARAQSVRSFTRDQAVTREAADVYARMRAMSISSVGTGTTAAGPTTAARDIEIPFKPLRAFSVSSAATTATSASRSASWPLPPLYLSQKFMLLYGPFLNNYDPTHFIAHAEFLIVLTWYLRIAPAIAVGILGKIVPPYFQFAVMFSGDGVLFLYLLWKRPFAGKAANMWQLFLAFCRAGIFLFVFVFFIISRYFGVEWMTEMIVGSLILSCLGVHGLFLTSSGIKFATLALKGFKRKSPPRALVATDPVHIHKSTSESGSLPRGAATRFPSATSRRDTITSNNTAMNSKPTSSLGRSGTTRTHNTARTARSDDEERYDPNAQRSNSPLLRHASPNPISAATASASASSSAAPAPAAAATVTLPPPTVLPGNVYSEEDYFSRARAMKAALNAPLTPTASPALTFLKPAATAAPARPQKVKRYPTLTRKPTQPLTPPTPVEQLEMHTVTEQNNPYLDT
ncbi:hypothetical protein DFJ77DRAFT_454053 [Powellomyces hirtus]|nr:hypothetical protein DFJ77DRAFT_481980 [Powellomyces hirtus]KAI8919380.1 hypothetical protein DFJ77DRAFT_454053 [Powellomyces hirtus]